jgi:hypothetical protein
MGEYYYIKKLHLAALCILNCCLIGIRCMERRSSVDVSLLLVESYTYFDTCLLLLLGAIHDRGPCCCWSNRNKGSTHQHLPLPDAAPPLPIAPTRRKLVKTLSSYIFSLLLYHKMGHKSSIFL